MYTSLCLCVCYSYLFTYLPLYLFIYSLIFLKACLSTLPSHGEGFKQLP